MSKDKKHVEARIDELAESASKRLGREGTSGTR